ncbi:hypothetical protein BMR11_16540 [Methylococcaceae bacterium CS5]|nr:hypothetical protein BMR11_16540 [Methylococcaceae bacterium CS5]
MALIKVGHLLQNILPKQAIPDIKENSIKNDIFWKVSAFEAEHVIHLLLKLRIMIADNVGEWDLCDRTFFILVRYILIVDYHS